jgi:Rap1a immunity proteins
MRLLLVAFLILASATTATAVTQGNIYFQSGNDLLQKCADPSPHEVGGVYEDIRCMDIVAAYADSFTMAAMLCKPKIATLRQVADVVVNYLREHPEKRHFTAVSLALTALTAAFPCNQK